MVLRLDPRKQGKSHFSQPDVSSDGRFVAGLSSAAWTAERINTLGVPEHATVIDLERFAIEVPFPLSFHVPGAERDHRNVQWRNRAPAVATPMEVAGSLLSAMDSPTARPRPTPEEARWRVVVCERLQRACMQAADRRGQPDWLLPEAFRYSEALDGGAAVADTNAPWRRADLAWRSALVADRLASTIGVEPGDRATRLRRQAVTWYECAAQADGCRP